jgi:hypothetical protein
VNAPTNEFDPGRPENTADLRLEASGTGLGVFARRDFEPAEPVMPFRGPILHLRELPHPYDEVDDHYVQVDTDLYMGPSRGLDDFVNHSCDPNCGLRIAGEQVGLIAIRHIVRGEEICWDYSTTMSEDDWTMECRCGSKQCRGVVAEYRTLPESTRKRYEALDIVPAYVLEKMKEARP